MFLTVENARKSFGSEHVLNGVAFSLEEQHTLSILGQSGSGKTTLLKGISGLETFDSGRILLNGNDVSSTPPQKRGIVYLYQETLLFPHLNVYENVAFGLRLQKKKESEIIEATNRMLGDLELQDHARKQPDQLSGGQRQRVAFGRAIIVNPQLLLLDEPFGKLDVEIRGRMQELFKELASRYRITTLFVTHDLKEALLMGDRIGHLRGGVLKVYPETSEFIRDPDAGVQQEIAFWSDIDRRREK